MTPKKNVGFETAQMILDQTEDCKVTSGPNNEQFTQSLTVGDSSCRIRIRFEMATKSGHILCFEGYVNSLEREDGSGKSWNIGQMIGKAWRKEDEQHKVDATLAGYYQAARRHGNIKVTFRVLISLGIKPEKMDTMG